MAIIKAIVLLSIMTIKASAISCDQFFDGTPWPKTKDLKDQNVVRLCQTQTTRHHPDDQLFATLFSTKNRIPIYSANVVTKVRGRSYSRPGEEYWERVATALCDISRLPRTPVDSNVGSVSPVFRELCLPFQAVARDYKHSPPNIEKGHLCPSHINSQDRNKQIGTFTLTNAAPQYRLFNQNQWNEYECVTRASIRDLVDYGQNVFIMTGTHGSQGKLEPGFGRTVTIPAYFWKAVCYPGQPHTKNHAWGYAIVKKNVNKKLKADYQSYMTLRAFADQFFLSSTPPFSPDCMNAGFGRFRDIFRNWNRYLVDNCSVKE